MTVINNRLIFIFVLHKLKQRNWKKKFATDLGVVPDKHLWEYGEAGDSFEWISFRPVAMAFSNFFRYHIFPYWRTFVVLLTPICLIPLILNGTQVTNPNQLNQFTLLWNKSITREIVNSFTFSNSVNSSQVIYLTLICCVSNRENLFILEGLYQS